ncbi:D-glycero-alpha-D-manno-heptose-1,7-bisphosphate 7-phosphatase [Seleniivibrio woodruffii]|uniref:D,D-heptose 1,7-bisphosphate phosphatase n=1 Tax=Seleniivibrio woodruffii TaxID=1078050 RepID=A0A4R1KBN4_9BACT|nr:HAD family hydrolase [Seleniivibrio woodruffii]TCK61874.1 D-alpha,beta-D-heptose 1,7-bisphosphate phosphatase [Seleniivibrio woodruffii]TVZ35011.1 D-glycero-D-manno-heptose 1,7-bisphosphate phosphatase [Seleniivibrio woodruffii]
MTKGLFLDRDGIVNIDKGYIHKAADIEFVDGIFDLCLLANFKGYKIFIVTNQAGVDRGYYTEEDVQTLHAWMRTQFEARGVEITDFFYCPHHPNFSGDCGCRKPNPGMLLLAMNMYDVDASKSVMVGDKVSDVQAGRNAGVGLNIIVSSEYFDGKPEEADYMFSSVEEVYGFLKERL